jgi:hypothetical protein
MIIYFGRPSWNFPRCDFRIVEFTKNGTAFLTLLLNTEGAAEKGSATVVNLQQKL